MGGERCPGREYVLLARDQREHFGEGAGDTAVRNRPPFGVWAG